MWGIWGTDPRGLDPEGEPFEIPMQGMGVFSCRQSAWQGFNPLFRGFGGEEGYIHEKFRQAGGRCLCLPWLRWITGSAGRRASPIRSRSRRNCAITSSATPSSGLTWPRCSSISTSTARGEACHPVATAALRRIAGATVAALPGRRSVRLTRDYSPLVSCLCMTYNRSPDKQYLIEEAIESFLRQDYPNKELIVLNDCPGQELVCDAPGVRIINLPERFAVARRQAQCRGPPLASGELLAIWDDDDISLPWRLTLSVELLGDADYFNPRRYWQTHRDGTFRPDGADIGHLTSLYTRTAFETVGGYPSQSYAADTVFHDTLLATMERVVEPSRGNVDLTIGQLYYIYRIGISPVHISIHAEGYYTYLGTLPIQSGRFVLNPHWRQDYEAEIRALVNEAQTVATR